MEVCIDSVESALNAERGGAIRVELCSNLMEGGTTPSLGRPRGGDFLYSDDEFYVMKEDIRILKEGGADGIVFGILSRIIKAITTFDMLKDPFTSLEILIQLGFDRILTSGQDSSALEGLPTISHLVEKAKERIIIVPGGGITERNLERILRGSGAKEFHCSARTSFPSLMSYKNTNTSMGASLRPPEFVNKVSTYEKVKNFVFVA
ncbi:Copper homeostasis protein cutC-like protein, partial [Acropora cervicornis]